jgi:hypothetical protein
MTQESIVDVFPIWMLFSAAFGFMIGQACGDYYRHRKCLEEANEELRDRLEQTQAGDESVSLAIQRQRGILHDIHKHVLAVSKGLEKHPHNPNKINGRIATIRPFHNLYLQKCITQHKPISGEQCREH